MISRLEHAERDAAPPEPPAPDAGSVDAWLNVLTAMLRVPVARREAIRDELAEHLRQRCRELMLAGAGEPEAAQRAIDELGETAELARRLERANRLSTRRLVMNLSLLGVGVAVVSAGVLTMSSPSPTLDASVFEETMPVRTPPATVAELSVTMTEDMTLRAMIKQVRDHDGLGVFVDWSALGHAGIDPDEPLGISGRAIEFSFLLEMLAERTADEGNPFDWRYTAEAIEISNRRSFDRREAFLAVYDIRAILEHGIGVDEVTDLLLGFVSPEDWMECGGDLAQQEIVGGRLFVEAPPRMHDRVQWILRELADGGEIASAEDTPAG